VSETVIVVPEPEPAAAPPAGGDVAAGMALVTAEGAAQEAAQAVVIAESADANARMALDEALTATACCEHCTEHAERLSSLEEGRGAELAAELEQVELDAPAPPVKEKPAPKEKGEPAPPAPKRGMWPV
jgi:hypothetical protein